MGTCQSSACQCVREENVEKHFLLGATKEDVALTSKSKHGENTKHLIFDLLSPTYTEATTPASTFITPSNGSVVSLSLTSYPSAKFEGSTTSNKNSIGRTQPFRFTFDTPARRFDGELHGPSTTIIEEEATTGTGATGPEEESGSAIVAPLLNRAKAPIQALSIQKPSLLAPPKGQADVLWNNAKSTGTVNETMIREFNRLKRQVSIAERQEKQRKRNIKIDDREKDLKMYRSLWDQFVELEKLNSKARHQETETDNINGKEGHRHDAANRQKGTNQSLGSQSHRSQLERKLCMDDDDKRCRSGVIKLSEFGLQAQNTLQEVRSVARKTAISGVQMRGSNSYSRIRLHEKFDAGVVVAGESVLPPNETQSMPIPRHDFAPIRNIVTASTSSMTDRKVLVEDNDNGKKRDEASGITRKESDYEFRTRRSRRSQALKHRDDMSIVSSCASESYGGEIPSRLRSAAAFGAKRHMERDVNGRKHQSVAELVEIGANSAAVCTKTRQSLGSRIAEVEKKIQTFQTARDHGSKDADSGVKQVVDTKADCVENALSSLENSSPLQSMSSPVIDVQSPRAQIYAAAFAGNDLEPTKLEQMFDESTEISHGNASDKTLAEKIVLRNASKCYKQAMCHPCAPPCDINLMSTDEFRRMSSSHAWIQVVKCPVKTGSFVVSSAALQDTSYNKSKDSSTSTPRIRDAGVIAGEVGAVLSKFKDNVPVIDVHEMFLKNGLASDETSGNDTHIEGTLFCA
jgi:hypothetical protein